MAKEDVNGGVRLEQLNVNTEEMAVQYNRTSLLSAPRRDHRRQATGKKKTPQYL